VHHRRAVRCSGAPMHRPIGITHPRRWVSMSKRLSSVSQAVPPGYACKSNLSKRSCLERSCLSSRRRRRPPAVRRPRARSKESAAASARPVALTFPTPPPRIEGASDASGKEVPSRRPGQTLTSAAGCTRRDNGEKQRAGRLAKTCWDGATDPGRPPSWVARHVSRCQRMVCLALCGPGGAAPPMPALPASAHERGPLEAENRSKSSCGGVSRRGLRSMNGGGRIRTSVG
jgi:hypothetical protein